MEFTNKDKTYIMKELKYYKEIDTMGGVAWVRTSEEEPGKIPKNWYETECSEEEYLEIKNLFDNYKLPDFAKAKLSVIPILPLKTQEP